MPRCRIFLLAQVQGRQYSLQQHDMAIVMLEESFLHEPLFPREFVQTVDGLLHRELLVRV